MQKKLKLTGSGFIQKPPHSANFSCTISCICYVVISLRLRSLHSAYVFYILLTYSKLCLHTSHYAYLHDYLHICSNSLPPLTFLSHALSRPPTCINFLLSVFEADHFQFQQFSSLFFASYKTAFRA